MTFETESIMRELWRLGRLLTGSDPGATASLLRVLAAHDDIRKLAEDRRRRLLVLGAREWLSHSPAQSTPAWDRMPALRSLDAQPREVWLLHDVEQWGDVEVSRATGVARSAIEGFRRTAHLKLSGACGPEFEHARSSLAAELKNADEASGIDSARRQSRRFTLRRRALAAVKLAALLGVLALIAWIGRDLQRASERERANQAIGEAVSNPMPREGGK
ncbi:MAG: hypothetical protein JNK58_13065 [Phycisphaerae bacterium]|nr:hypothetical protein [Phycisphaerae bacterium]